MPKRAKKSKRERKQVPFASADRKLTQDNLQAAAVRAARARWHSEGKALREIEAAAIVDPVGVAARLIEFTDQERQRYGRNVRLRFGVDVRATQGDAKVFVTSISEGRVRFHGRGDYKPLAALSVVRPERTPRNLSDEAYLDELLLRYTIADLANHAMVDIGWDVKQAGHGVEDMAWTMCQLFVFLYRHRFVFSAVAMKEAPGLHPRLRGLHTAFTAGWVGSRINLGRNRRLAAALTEEWGGVHQALLRELSGATFVEWADAQRPNDLVSSVTRSLEKLGRETAIRPGKVRDAPYEDAGVAQGSLDAGAEDEDLEEFELRETLRQESERLKEWAESAGFSGREAQMHELDIKTNFDTAAAARVMGVPENKARDYRSRYIAKLRRAAGL
jgi:hypothetical protein